MPSVRVFLASWIFSPHVALVAITSILISVSQTINYTNSTCTKLCFPSFRLRGYTYNVQPIGPRYKVHLACVALTGCSYMIVSFRSRCVLAHTLPFDDKLLTDMHRFFLPHTSRARCIFSVHRVVRIDFVTCIPARIRLTSCSIMFCRFYHIYFSFFVCAQVFLFISHFESIPSSLRHCVCITKTKSKME